MDQQKLYRDIAGRCDGDIYMGVVGPVRTGKSTFIKRFMELLVLPNMEDEAERERTREFDSKEKEKRERTPMGALFFCQQLNIWLHVMLRYVIMVWGDVYETWLGKNKVFHIVFCTEDHLCQREEQVPSSKTIGLREIHLRNLRRHRCKSMGKGTGAAHE